LPCRSFAIFYFPDRAGWLVLALDTLFWRVSWTIVGTVPTTRRVSPPLPDWLSRSTSHLTSSDRIVETSRKNGCFKEFEAFCASWAR
jgi:hypothetical protein